MNQAKPLFPGVTVRMACWRAVLQMATLLGMLACWPLWSSSRDYPLLPVVSWFPTPPAPWDQWVAGAGLLALVLAFRWYRPAIIYFLATTLFLYLGDQNRGQPWLYMYWLMMALTLFPETIALAAGRVVLSAIYLWCGIHKCNANYFHLIPGWFVSPAAAWGWPPAVIQLCRAAVAGAPAVEILIGLLLWVPGWRWVGLGAVASVHGAALLFLGPLGHNYNWVVWPWNLAMPLLAFTLFAARVPFRAAESLGVLRQSKSALAVTSLICLLPVLNLFGWWDSYFSFSLYSADLAVADVYVTEKYGQRLPASLRQFVHPVRPAYNPQWQEPFLFDHTSWSMHVLGAPELPEPRGYLAMFRRLNSYAGSPGELHMVLSPRRGPILYCQGETVLPMPAATQPAR
jgi:hypothetical protein